MELNKELEKLKQYMDAGRENDFKKQSDFIHATFTSEENRETIDKFVSAILSGISHETKELVQKAETLLIR